MEIKQEQSSKAPCCSRSGDTNDSCCIPKVVQPNTDDPQWVKGRIATPVGTVLQVTTTLNFQDIVGSWKARWGINRMNYRINPGLYCVGFPDENSPVLVTANYKMSFDRLRKELANINAWIVVLDTKGINVWCAAGKGTFGTTELLFRLGKVKLSKIVSHRTIILPQLGAPGIIAHEVQKQSGFKVVYGPVRAADIEKFISTGMKATEEMRTVKFTLWDRFVLTPIEIVGALKTSFIVFGVLFILNSVGFGQYGFVDLYSYIGAILAGCVITPILLPWIPGRAFAFKGWLIGLLWVVAIYFMNGWPGVPTVGWLKAFAFLLILPAISAYGAMNFTGCSTYTSFTGVKKEMKIALPLLISSAGVGLLLLIADSIVKLLN